MGMGQGPAVIGKPPVIALDRHTWTILSIVGQLDYSFAQRRRVPQAPIISLDHYTGTVLPVLG